MKFSHSIQFNAVPDWSSHYIAYSNLKKLIYQLEKSVNQGVSVAPGATGGVGSEDLEAVPLILTSEDTDAVFIRALDQELERIETFYRPKQTEILHEAAEVLHDASSFSEQTSSMSMRQKLRDRQQQARRKNSKASNFDGRAIEQSEFDGEEDEDDQEGDELGRGGDEDDDESDEDVNETTAMRLDSAATHKDRRRSHRAEEIRRASIDQLRKGSQDSWKPFRPRKASLRMKFASGDDGDTTLVDRLFAHGVILKKRLVNVYVSLCELKSYIQLNKTGFSKVCKKYDKTLDRNIKAPYVNEKVGQASTFLPHTIQQIDDQIAAVESAYADLITEGDLYIAKRELRLHLREHVVWERNTVWRDMIGIERKAQAANLGVRRTLLGGGQDTANTQLQGDVSIETKGSKEIDTPVGRYRCPSWLFTSTFLLLMTIFVIFLALLALPLMKRPEQQNCLAMLVFVSLLWATEVIPLFVTALLVPFLTVILRVLCSEDQSGHRLKAPHAAKEIFAAMWTPVIMLLLGGFTIAAALSKFHIAKILATFVLSKAGSRPRTVLLANMFVAMILSMWISNVASPVLCYSIVQPLLRNLPSDSSFSKALVLGIALAANVGGAASPIASPQNIIALENMKPQPSWGAWFVVTIPTCIVSIVLIWAFLLATFQPAKAGVRIIPIRPSKDRFTGVQWFISAITVITIILWCVHHQIKGVLGDMGVAAIIPILAFFGTGILTKEDFNNFLWTIIILAAGGLSLGRAVSSSGLLHTIAGAITAQMEQMSLYAVLVSFAALILIIATFISHTVAALIILPLVHQVGQGMVQPHPNLLVMASALMCSAAMGLPTSGFPNMTAIMMEDPQTGQRYLRVQHFLTRGIPASLIVFFVVITLGYALLRLIGL